MIDFLVDTDVLAQHLITTDYNNASYMEKLMQIGVCYTTVMNASELFFAVTCKDEKEIVVSLLSSLKVLGLHSRYSLSVPRFNTKTDSYRDALICVVAEINKLKIISLKTERYLNTSLEVFHPQTIIDKNVTL